MNMNSVIFDIFPLQGAYAVNGLTACYVKEERRIYVYKVIEWPHDKLNERIADYLEGVMGLIYDFFTE